MRETRAGQLWRGSRASPEMRPLVSENSRIEGSVGAASISDSESQPLSALFPSEDDRRRREQFLGAALAAAQARIVEGSVTPTVDPSSIRDELLRFDFAASRPFEELI